MRLEQATLLTGVAAARGLTVVIDVFRASTTACHVAAFRPASYMIVGDSRTAVRLASSFPRPFLVGKPEPGCSLIYDVPNSPTRISEHLLHQRTIIHRTAAGARGILRAANADDVILAGFVNVAAVARYVQLRRPTEVTLVAMGHEGTVRSIEDELCSTAIAAALVGEAFDLAPWLPALRRGPGRYFFADAQDEYPLADFERCTELDRFAFVLRAEIRGDYAELRRIDC